MKVLNKYTHGNPAGSVNIMRPGKFGNPFAIGRDGNRADVIRKFEAWINTRPDLISAAKHELKGKDLVCCCAPQACHGDILLRIANS